MDKDSVNCRYHPADTKQNICTTSPERLGRWSNIVQMLNKCFVFAGHMSAEASLRSDLVGTQLFCNTLVWFAM